MRDIQTGYAPVEHGELYYETTGDGPALLLIHAGVADHTMWEPQLEPFARNHRVITYDTRGFGQSRTENTAFSNRKDIRDLLAHVGVRNAVLVGNSRGGQIAIDTALEYPHIVSGIVWICGGLGGYELEPTKEEMEAFSALEALYEVQDWKGVADLETRIWGNGIGQPDDRATETVRAKLWQMIYDNNVREDGEAQPVVLDPPSAGRLHELKVPVLAVIGDLDTSTAQAAAEKLASEAPDVQKVVFHSVAHMASMEKPDEFNAIVLRFLSDHGL